MSEEMKTVAVRTSKKKKQRWEDYVEESNQPSLSQLIRIATEREIARGNPLEPPEKGGEDTREPSPEVMQKLEQISNKLQSLDRRLTTIESDRYGDEELTGLATEIFRILPRSIMEIQQAIAQKEDAFPGENEEIDVEYMADAMGDDELESKPPSEDTTQSGERICTGSIDDIAAILDADEEAVQLAINRLQSTTHSVYSVESAAGTVHYYKED
jgi:hypothetical protein